MSTVQLQSRYVLFSDSVPRREGGSGTGVLGWNWLEAMREETALIIAPRPPQAETASRIRQESPVPLHYLPPTPFPDTKRWYSKIRAPLELLLFLLALPGVCRAIRASGANRIFAFAGARFWFLLNVRLLRLCLGLPVEIYLVDDFESWQRLHGKTTLVPLLRLLEGTTLRRLDRVWAISPGYVRHLGQKYGARAEWLPVTVRGTTVELIPYRRREPDIRSFIFMGAINALYRDALFAFAQALADLNRSGALGYQCRLDIYTYSSWEQCDPIWKDVPHIHLHCREPDAVRHAALRDAWAIILAFAFEEKSRLMVQTSFSTKFTESLTCGRPVIFFGPEDSAVVAHARAEKFPLVATSRETLPAVLHEIEREDTPDLISRYAETLRQFHSPQALRGHLAAPLRTGP